MEKWLPIGFDEALKITVDTVAPLGVETVSISDCSHRISANDLCARVDSPSIDASLKDGYAVKSGDIENADSENPVPLTIAGSVAAGDGEMKQLLKTGQAIRVLTGAKIPAGADAVLAEEFVHVTEGSSILAQNIAEPGRNIMPRATDVACGNRIVKQNQMISPGYAGLLAAAGLSRIPVYKRPRISVIATGDEVVAPGEPLPEGKLYASNMVTLCSFCHDHGMETGMMTARDSFTDIRQSLERAIHGSDAVLTSGGAWTGDRDLVVKVLSDMGWKQLFHRIRIGPGKAVGFGILNDKPVFILPGGPPSNLMGFLQIALPGLLKLSGHSRPGLHKIRASLASDLRGRDIDWTQFVWGKVDHGGSMPVFHPLRQKGRLQTMAEANAVVAIPEGETLIASGTTIPVQILS